MRTFSELCTSSNLNAIFCVTSNIHTLHDWYAVNLLMGLCISADRLFFCDAEMYDSDDEADIPIDQIMFLEHCEHKICFSCMKNWTKARFEDNKQIPHCPAQGCTQLLTQHELTHLYQDDNREEIHAQITKSYLKVALTSMKVVACPRPGCNNSLMPTAETTAENCKCSCGMEYCSLCQEPFHYGQMSCTEAADIGRTWYWWLDQGHGRYLRHKAAADASFAAALEEHEARRRNFDDEVVQAMQRRKELEADEGWKVANCKRCPHCKRVINRISGCSQMACGMDADGGNDQPGCGQHFRWDDALPYQLDTSHLNAAEKTFDEAPPATDTEEVLLGRTTSGEAILATCDVCHGVCGEIAAQCINCPAEFTVCFTCMPTMMQGGYMSMFFVAPFHPFVFITH
eukprot:m.1202266 g.1202266  ORF g.1202266 m.1202266 type:complete len:400 (-) comp24576_c0_seq47:2641-3840(-)